MVSHHRQFLSKKEAVASFEAYTLPIVQQTLEKDGVPDWPARREAWNNFLDSLHKDGSVTDRAYQTWTYPPSVRRLR